VSANCRSFPSLFYCLRSAARESARRPRNASNNLHQMVIALHNNHHTQVLLCAYPPTALLRLRLPYPMRGQRPRLFRNLGPCRICSATLKRTTLYGLTMFPCEYSDSSTHRRQKHDHRGVRVSFRTPMRIARWMRRPKQLLRESRQWNSQRLAVDVLW